MVKNTLPECNSVILLTGASAGIGEALARLYAQKGAKLVLMARREARLKNLAAACQKLHPSCEALALTCDVSAEDAVKAAIEKSVKHFGKLDLVIANAGMPLGGSFQNLENAAYQRIFATNVFGVMHTIRYALPELIKTRGRIGIIGSVNSYVALPHSSPYCMSKFALKAFADCLRFELAKKLASVTFICPGFVATEIRKLDDNGIFDPERSEEVPKWLILSAEKAALAIQKAIARGRREKVITLHGKCAVFLQRHLPGLVNLTLRQAFRK